MQHHTRPVLAVALVSALLLLSGCSFLEPTRDADGRVTGTRDISATQLRVGDCFSFIDMDDLSQVTVTPCQTEHTHIVIGMGELSETKVAMSESLQVAVSLACADSFDAYVASVPADADPEQEFLVATLDKPGGTVSAYTCVATDGPSAAG